jgi:uncharacterized protein YjiK
MNLIFTIYFTFIVGCISNSQTNNITLFNYFNNSTNPTSIKLSKKLNEISGLACTPDGRLFAHSDEAAILYEINQTSGEISKTFSVGKKTVKEDFEGLAIVNNFFYLVSSNGTIYEFSEGKNEKDVKYIKYKTKLSSRYDVEGLCYDPQTNALLLACKGYPGKNYKNNRAIYSFSLTTKELDKEPRFLLPIKKIIKEDKYDFIRKLGEFFFLPTENTFAPSGINKHPSTGTFFIIAARGNAIIEISDLGEILGKALLKKEFHNQPEGITFLPDQSLIIADEGGSKRATLTKYPLLKEE